MLRGGQKSCTGGGKIAKGGIFARASNAQAKIILPLLTNFSSTPLIIIKIIIITTITIKLTVLPGKCL